MIEVNLIPDVKQEFIRAQRTRNAVISFSILAMIIAAGLVVLLAVVLGAQRVSELVADNTIKSEYNKLKNVENINSLITIQNQLQNVTELNDQKIVGSRLFDVLTAINPQAPNDIRMSTVTLSPSDNQLAIEGVASNSFTAADVMKKTILNTKIEYSLNGENRSAPLATEVDLSDASYGEDASRAKVLRFKVVFQYPEELFKNNVADMRIVSPTGSIDMTDSKRLVPDSLFTTKPTDLKETN